MPPSTNSNDAPGPPPPPNGQPDTTPLRVLIVDDDPVARARTRDLLGALPGVTVVGECADGDVAVAVIGAVPVDIVVLDVQMPGLDGFGVIQRVGPSAMPAVVFTSAYAEFAVRAFEAYALDYVLKPFDDARLLLAFERARRDVALRRAAGGPGPAGPDSLAGTVATDPRLQMLLEMLTRPARPRYPDALAIRAGAQYAVVRVADIDWIEADGNYARVYSQKKTRLVSKSLAVLEREVLDPARFVRVHRSTVVNVARVAAAEPGLHGDVELLLHDGTRIACSRRYRARLEERLYFTA